MDTIKATLGRLVVAEMVVEKLMGQTLPVRASYHIFKVVQALRTEVGSVNRQREAWIRELGVQEGNEITVTPDNQSTFYTRLTELYAIEAELPVAPIQLSDIDASVLSGNDLQALAPLMSINL